MNTENFSKTLASAYAHINPPVPQELQLDYIEDSK